MNILSSYVSSGFFNEVKWTLAEMNLIALGSYFSDRSDAQAMTKLPLYANIAAFALKGIQTESLSQTMRCVAKVALGIAGTAAIAYLDHKVIARARNILTCGGISGAIVWSGVKEIKQTWKGIDKILVGLVGLAATTYMVYNTYTDLSWWISSPGALSMEKCQSFVQSHQDEINQIYETKAGIGDWKRTDSGRSKIAFTHPELPQAIIKIPTYSPFRSADDLKLHFDNIQHGRNIIEENRYEYISIPDTYLIPSDKGTILCETKFEFKDSPTYLCEYMATDEFDDFIKKSRFCDIILGMNHNAQFLKGPCNIGVYDLDCRLDQ